MSVRLLGLHGPFTRSSRLSGRAGRDMLKGGTTDQCQRVPLFGTWLAVPPPRPSPQVPCDAVGFKCGVRNNNNNTNKNKGRAYGQVSGSATWGYPAQPQHKYGIKSKRESPEDEKPPCLEGRVSGSTSTAARNEIPCPSAPVGPSPGPRRAWSSRGGRWHHTIYPANGSPPKLGCASRRARSGLIGLTLGLSRSAASVAPNSLPKRGQAPSTDVLPALSYALETGSWPAVTPSLRHAPDLLGQDDQRNASNAKL